jgi:hypothetical protein
MNDGELTIDTSRILYLLNGHRLMAALRADQRIYRFNIAEIERLIFGKIAARVEKKILLFLSDVILIGLTNPIRRFTVALGKNRRLQTSEAIITASAVSMSGPLATAKQSMEKLGGLM